MSDVDLNSTRLELRSPALLDCFSRHFSAEECEYLSLVFQVAMEAGGSAEYYYVRPVGMSFNPRPARVAMILLEHDSAATPNQVGAAMLASVYNPRWPSISQLRIKEGTWHLFLEPTPEINLACLLDKVRHIHQINSVSEQEKSEIWQALLREVDSSINLARSANQALETKLLAARRNLARRIAALSSKPFKDITERHV